MAERYKILGDITDTQLTNFTKLQAGSSAYDFAFNKLIKAGGEELRGVSDPLEKIMSAVTQFTEKHGLVGELGERYKRLTEAVKDGEEMTPAHRQLYSSLKMGSELREHATKAASSAKAPTVKTAEPVTETVKAADDGIIDFGEDFGKVRFVGDDAIESSGPIKFNPVETQPSAAGVKKEFYHGTQSAVDLASTELDPLSHATGRTPLAGFYGSDIDTAKAYAEYGGVGAPGKNLPKGNLYKFTAEFDSPSRLVDANEIAPSSFVDFLRESLPESGTIHKSNLLKPDMPGADIVYNFREKFDETLANNKIVNPTYFQAMDALDTVHSTYKPIDYAGKSHRAQSAIAARKYGIDALTFTDVGGDDVIAMLDPHDVQSKVGRKNISSIEIVPKEPVTKRVGPTPPESGTTLKNVGEESVTVGKTGRLTTSAATAKKMDDAAKKKIAEFTSDPEELYRKFLGHVGDIKREGGILDERLGSGVRNLDPNDIRVAAINRLGMETGLVEDAGKYDPHGALSKIRNTLETNKTFADQAILDEAKVSGRNVVVGGRSLKDLQKENPGKSIDELIEINKREQVNIMNPKSATVVDSTKPLSVGTSTDLPTETKPIVPEVDDVAPKAASEAAPSSSATVKTTAGVVKDAIDKTKSSSTTRKVAESLDAAKNAVKGKANARNLLLAGAASIVGVGLYKRNRQTRIEPDEQYY